MPGKNFVGKPCAGKPPARFDEGDRWIVHLKPVSTLPVEKKREDFLKPQRRNENTKMRYN
jgi:hypothetical protein